MSRGRWTARRPPTVCFCPRGAGARVSDGKSAGACSRGRRGHLHAGACSLTGPRDTFTGRRRRVSAGAAGSADAHARSRCPFRRQVGRGLVRRTSGQGRSRLRDRLRARRDRGRRGLRERRTGWRAGNGTRGLGRNGAGARRRSGRHGWVRAGARRRPRHRRRSRTRTRRRPRRRTRRWAWRRTGRWTRRRFRHRTRRWTRCRTRWRAWRRTRWWTRCRRGFRGWGWFRGGDRVWLGLRMLGVRARRRRGGVRVRVGHGVLRPVGRRRLWTTPPPTRPPRHQSPDEVAVARARRAVRRRHAVPRVPLPRSPAGGWRGRAPTSS